MRTAKRLLGLAGFVACLGLTTVATAADNCSGTFVQVAMHTGNVIVRLSDDHDAPGHMAIGSCDAETFRCTFKDKDGDAWTTDESVAGVWKIVGGTGKYAKAKSSGWSKMIRKEVGPEGMIYVGVWGGECSMHM
jgi:hypothetical protein